MLLYLPLFACLLLIPKRWLSENKLFFWCVHFFYWLVLKCSLVPITVNGLEHIPDIPAIIVANHQSSLDIPLVGCTLQGYPHIWLATAYLMKSPILRFVLPHLALIVDMSTPQKSMRSLAQALRYIRDKKKHVIIFPEGSRYVDNRVHEFFAGFAMLAGKTKRPVVPVYIAGVNNVYPPKSFLVHYYPITVVVGAPMHQKTDEAHDVFKQRVYNWFIAQQNVHER